MKKNSSKKISPLSYEPSSGQQQKKKSRYYKNDRQLKSKNAEKNQKHEIQGQKIPEHGVRSGNQKDKIKKQPTILQTVIVKVQKDPVDKKEIKKKGDELAQKQMNDSQRKEQSNPNINFIYQQQNNTNPKYEKFEQMPQKSDIDQPIHIPVVQIRSRNKNKQSKTINNSKIKDRITKQKHMVKLQKTPLKLSRISNYSSSSSPAQQSSQQKQERSSLPPIIGKKIRKNNINKQTQKNQESESQLKLTKKESFVSNSEILDNRKKQAHTKEQMQFRCLWSKIPKERFLTFLLIYQILISFSVLFCLFQNIYWMLSTIIVLVVPSYFGYQCVVNRIYNQPINEEFMEPNSQNTIDNISKGRQSRKVINTYFESIDQQQFTQENNSISSLSLAKKINKQSFCQQQKLQNLQNIKQVQSLPLKSHSLQRNFVFTEQKNEELTPNFLIVVPYLHQNQIQNFTKCSKCNSTQTNTRIKHCNRCNTCHFGYDHFCKWLSICIDGANYRHFIRFLISVWVLAITFSILGGVYIAQIAKLISTKQQNDKNIVIFSLLCFVEVESVISFIFCSYVLGYHLWLIGRGVSTRQHNIADKKRNERKIKGNCSIITSTYSKSLFHSLDDSYLLFFISKLPKELNRMMFEKNQSQNEKFLCKSRFLKDSVLQKSFQNQTLSQENQQEQKTDEQVQQQTQNDQREDNTINGILQPGANMHTLAYRKFSSHEEGQYQGYHLKSVGSPSKLSSHNSPK